MLGGRYCSIQGQAAAQLGFASNDGIHHTLYQVPMDEQMLGTLPFTRQTNDLVVEIWRDGALMMVSVKPVI